MLDFLVNFWGKITIVAKVILNATLHVLIYLLLFLTPLLG